MKTYSARKMASVPTDVLKEMLKGRFMLAFDDGEMEVGSFETIISSFGWEMHRKYPNTPMLKKHHARSVIGKGLLGSKTHLKLFGNIGWSVIDAYGNTPQLRDDIAREIYVCTNKLYNEMCTGLEEYVVSMDILHYFQVMDHPMVRETEAKLCDDPDSIDAHGKQISHALRVAPELMRNPISLAVRSGLVRESQAVQCLGVRGYAKDINGALFRKPILRGFCKGLRYFHDMLVESRSAAMSLFFQSAPLKNAEYFARKLQLLCQPVERLHPGDCSTQNYLHWHVRDEEPGQAGRPGRECDLDHLDGKYYLDEETNTLKAISPNDRHLIGRTLKMRFVMAGCAHPDPNGVCEVCFGKLSESIPLNTNLGQACASATTQQQSQLVLSNKHYIGSATVEGIVIEPEYQQYIGSSETGSAYLFKPFLKDKNPRLVIAASGATGMSDVQAVDDVRKLGITHVSEIDSISLIVTMMGQDIYVPINLNIARRKASMTYDMLAYIKHHGWDYNEKGNYIINLNNWDFEKQAFQLPLRDHSMFDYSKLITGIIESSKEKLKRRKKDNTSPESVLFELFDVINSRLNVNAALLDVIILGAMVRSVQDRDYRIPKAGTERDLGVTALTVPGRGAGPAMAYEDLRKTLLSCDSFLPGGRTHHPMDVFVCPQETVMHRRPDVFTAEK